VLKKLVAHVLFLCLMTLIIAGCAYNIADLLVCD